MLADARWEDPKRVRHKMAQAWARAGNRVLWVEEAVPQRPVEREEKWLALRQAPLREVEPGLYVLTPPPILSWDREARSWSSRVRHGLLAFTVGRCMRRLRMARAHALVIWQEASLYPLFDLIPHRQSILYMSDLYRYNRANDQSHQILFTAARRAEWVFTTSEKLGMELSAFQAHTIPHAVDLNWIDAHRDRQLPHLHGLPHPRVVFTGVATEKFDFRLLWEVSRRLPHVQFLVAGPVQDEALPDDLALSGPEAPPNLHLWGPQPVDDLPAIMAAADVLMLPYVRDPVRTRSGLPLKMFEYLAVGKPVLSTPFTDFEFADLQDSEDAVLLAEGPDAWAAALKEMTEGPLDSGASLRRRALAARNTYEHRIQLQRRILRGSMPASAGDPLG